MYKHIPEDQLPKTIPEAIRFCRKIDRLTQDEVGERMGLHASSVGKWERGMCFPVAKHWDKLVAAIPAIEHYFDVNSMKRHCRIMEKPGRRPGQPFNANPQRGPRGPNARVEHVDPPQPPVQTSRRPVQLELIQGSGDPPRRQARTPTQERVVAELARQMEALKTELAETKRMLRKAQEDVDYCVKIIDAMKRAKEAQFLLGKVLLAEEG